MIQMCSHLWACRSQRCVPHKGQIGARERWRKRWCEREGRCDVAARECWRKKASCESALVCARERALVREKSVGVRERCENALVCARERERELLRESGSARLSARERWRERVWASRFDWSVSSDSDEGGGDSEAGRQQRQPRLRRTRRGSARTNYRYGRK